MKELTVLSLFDGIAGARVALERAGFKIKRYYSSEIDRYAVSIANLHYPDIIQLGDVTNWKNWNISWEEIDLLIGGSPCTNLSKSGNGLGLNGDQSRLFWDYVDIWNHIKTVSKSKSYFLLENVKMRKKEWQDTMSEALGVEPILINSNLVSAQNRERLYWTNIPNVTLPEDRKIFLKDILFPDALPVLVHNIYGGWNEENLRVFFEKSPTIRANSGGGSIPSVLTVSAIESILDIAPASRTELSFASKITKWLEGVSYEDLKANGYVRALAPVEVERLQTYSSTYTGRGITEEDIVKISKTQRLKALGNSFTVDVIAHILSFIK